MVPQWLKFQSVKIMFLGNLYVHGTNFSHCFPCRTFAAIERENIEKELQEKLQHLFHEAEVCIYS